MTIKPVASSFDVFKNPSPVAESLVPVANNIKPVATTAGVPVKAAEIRTDLTANAYISDTAADVATPSASSVKPRVSVKA